MGEMIELVRTLHEIYGMVHGDLRSLNMVRCHDGRLRFYDFEFARPSDENPGVWDGGLVTEQYLAPNRDDFI